MRVLGRVRLSRATEESTSVERQREIIEGWANQNDHEIVGWAEDLDVSGSVDPFDTPALGPWLTEDRKHEWDIICSWKLDRISRRAVPMGKLFGWLLDNNKALVCASDSIDLSTPMGRLIAYVIATIAEGELEAIRERNRASAKKLRELGRWTGGKPIYGYQAVERTDGSGWELVPDEQSSMVLLRIIDQVLAGQSLTSIAGDLTAEGVLTPADYIRYRSGRKPAGYGWTANNIGRILRSKSLLGYTTHNGVTVRDDEGLPIAKGRALVSQDVYDRLQAALESRSVLSSNRTRRTSPLLGVALCGLCEANLYHRQVTGKAYRYYLCRRGHDPNIVKADELEELVEQVFLEKYGASFIHEKVYVPAEDHQTELDEAVRAVDEITPLLGTVTSTTMRKRLLDQLAALDSRISDLEQLPSSEAHWEWRELPETYAEAWDKADTEERRQLLLKRGVTAKIAVKGKIGRQHPGYLDFYLDAPDIESVPA
ncbi:MAG: recombinase family protein [Mycobacterium sp.]|uniref:recombinase family protein n=1 Tax=Mycobacterium sp. TaxID=1785 RepID=UPI001EC4C65C|nr:recombinase family protein [Mycobacterium sp.]MBV8789481.1 recombinase family protein [Mycobacterium sp.]